MASNDPTDTGGLFIGRRPGPAITKNQNANPIPTTTNATSMIRSSAPRSCRIPAARRTSFQA